MTEMTRTNEFDTSADRINRFLVWQTPELSSPTDPLIDALKAAAKTYDAKVSPDAKRFADESQSASLTRLARGAGMHVRPVRLKEQRIGEAPVPLLAFRKSDSGPDDPVLLHRNGKDWFVAEAAGEWKRKKCATFELQAFDDTAYMILPNLPEGKISGKQLLMFGLKRSRREIMAFMGLTLISGAAIALIPVVSSPLLDYIVPEGNVGLLVNVTLFFGLVLGVNILTRFAAGIAQLRMNGRMGFELRAAAIDRAIRVADKTALTGQVLPSAPVAALSTRSMEHWHRGVWSMVLSVLASILIALPSLFVIATASAIGAALIGVILLIILVLGYLISKRRIRVLLNGVATPQSWMTNAYEGLSMLDTVRSTAAEGRLFSKWTDAFLTLRHRFLSSDRVGVAASAIEGSVGGLLILSAVIALAVAGGVSNGSAPVALVIAAGNVAGAIVALLSAFSKSSMLGIQYRMIDSLLKGEAQPVGTGLVPPVLSGEISCQNLSCRHGNASRLAIDNVSFDVAAGDHIGITGPSGAGKSTLIKALLGLIECEEGGVRFDGMDMSVLDAQAIRQQIGIVGQSGQLFPGTLFENIAAGAPISNEKTILAAKKAGFGPDIEALPLGLNTPVGETECGFSGGQVQRILLARAFACKPKILILDEATSALDAELQDHVDWAIDEMNATVISIAHRLETLRNCDRILVLDGGRLVEQGSYHELVENDGLFGSLIRAEVAV